jgi:hypothetical protein
MVEMKAVGWIWGRETEGLWAGMALSCGLILSMLLSLFLFRPFIIITKSQNEQKQLQSLGEEFHTVSSKTSFHDSK